MPDIDAVERLLCERYNVRALDAGELTDALAQARKGSLVALTAVLDARDLYRWQEPIYAALAKPVAEPTPRLGFTRVAETTMLPVQKIDLEPTSKQHDEPDPPAETPAPRGRRS